MQLKNLTMSFGTQELFNDINLHIGENEKVGIVGVNGAGKTTFFKIIKGILEPERGKVILENLDSTKEIVIKVNGIALTDTTGKIYEKNDVYYLILSEFNPTDKIVVEYYKK